MQHKVKDEYGLPWIVDDEDFAARVWVEHPNLPANDIIIPRKLIAPEIHRPPREKKVPMVQGMLYTEVLDDKMEDMVREQIYLMLEEAYG